MSAKFYYVYPPLGTWRSNVIGGSKGGARDAPARGPNSFIFMQFSAKKLKNNSTFGSWRTPLGKILDPPLNVMGSVKLNLVNLVKCFISRVCMNK